jgi:hypothetical protein
MEPKSLRFRAELHSCGSVEAILECSSMPMLRNHIKREWLDFLSTGDTIRIIDKEEDNEE